MAKHRATALEPHGPEQKPVSFAQVLQRLRQVLSAEQTDRLRQQTGYNPRQRVATAYRLLLVSIEASLAGQTLGFATLRAYFMRRFGPIRSRAFQLRFKSTEAVAFFRAALTHLVSMLAIPIAPPLKGPLCVFSDVVAYDGSSQRVPRRGRRRGLRATVKTAGASKWVVGYSLKHGVAFEAQGGSGTAFEMHTFWSLVKTLKPNVLYLLDLGYFCRDIYVRARAQQAHILMRLKACAHTRSNLRVTAALEDQQVYPLRRMYTVSDYLRRAQRHAIRCFDLDVVWGYGRHRLPLRVVGVYHDRSWRLYLTTVSREQLSAHDVVATYRLRWLVEFLFRELKQQMDWGRSHTADPHALMALTYASLFAHALVRSLRIAAACQHDVPLESLRPLASLHTVRAFASDFVTALTSGNVHVFTQLIVAMTDCLLQMAYERHPSRSRPRLAAQLGAAGG